MKQYDFRMRFDGVDVSPDSLRDDLLANKNLPAQNVCFRTLNKAHGAALADVVIAATISGGAILVAAVINSAVNWYINKNSEKHAKKSDKSMVVRIDGHKKSHTIHYVEGQEIDAHTLDSISEECGEIVEIHIGRSQR
ncbi:MAG: hypothetical protein KC643_31680 [Nitrospira sp.]|nr:hypothetical protein [Nitrospira sp.]